MEGLQQSPSSLPHYAPAVPPFCGLTSRDIGGGGGVMNKISIIRAAFPSHALVNTNNLNPANSWGELHDFVPVSEVEVRRLVSTSPCKSCDLDPIPTTLLNDCIDIPTTLITSIVTLSLSKGVFPTRFKICLCMPSVKLKEVHLDNENMKNCWPVFNLIVFSPRSLRKLLHVDCFPTSPKQKRLIHFSPACRKSHSTESRLFFKSTQVTFWKYNRYISNTFYYHKVKSSYVN